MECSGRRRRGSEVLAERETLDERIGHALRAHRRGAARGEGRARTRRRGEDHEARRPASSGGFEVEVESP
ncbi:MAG: hypothetical protein JST59_08380 [Actinobacteria bacterium]|nr:hypothetical protein [Actinomycetota bacterium]